MNIVFYYKLSGKLFDKHYFNQKIRYIIDLYIIYNFNKKIIFIFIKYLNNMLLVFIFKYFYILLNIISSFSYIDITFYYIC